MNENVMGFCDLPIRKYIFIGGSEEGEQHPYGWYSLNADGTKSGILQFGLRGAIVALKIIKKFYKDKPVYKLDVFINADRPYAIRSGINTTFTRGFILSLHQYLVDTGNIEKPFTIGIKVGESDKVIFSSLFDYEDTYCKAEWSKEAKLGPLIHEIQTALFQDLNEDNCEECRPKVEPKIESKKAVKNK